VRRIESSFLENGYAAAQQNNIDAAVQWFKKAVQQHPNNPEPLACLGQALFWQGEHQHGISYLRKTAKLIAKKTRKNKDITDLLAITEQLQACNDYPGSLEFARQAVQINHTDARAYQLLALTYARLNQHPLALQANQQAIKLLPDNPRLNIQHAALLADTKHFDTAKQRLEQVLHNPELSPTDQFHAQKEIARILDKLGEYDTVFEHLHQASTISKKLTSIQQLDASAVPAILAINKAGFDRELLHRWANESFTNELVAPVFLLGFLRSGTTLIQEVLDAHPQIFVADETELVAALRSELDRLSGESGTTPEQLQKIELVNINHLRHFYWEQVNKRYGKSLDRQLFIDKTSLNTIDLGLINCVFPDAKVIFVQRDPRDVCLSCYMQTFALTPATMQFLSWDSTLSFYCQTMNWWLYIKQQLSLNFIECRYEDAVTQFETTFQDIFRFLDLSWNESVIEFHQKAAKKFIASPSYNQVSQPLYTSSVCRWKNYRAEFSSVAETLLPIIKALGYEECWDE
jgi:tetratricopeptide (TPR) repeat protein